MKERGNIIFANAATIFLFLILNIVQGNSQQWHEQVHRSYFDYESFDKQTSISPNSDIGSNTRLITNWRWPFKKPSTIEVTRQPLSVTDDNGDKALPNDKFIFPDTDQQMQPRIGTVPSCKGKTYCEDVPDYPSNFVNDIIRNNQTLRNYENIDSMDLTFRIESVSTESLCISTEQIVYPKTAENVNKQWLYVLNNSNFTQGVHIETCAKEGDGCKIIGGFAEGYVTTCKQKFIYRQLAAIVENSVSHELFRFPTSCCCQVQFVGTSTRNRSERSARDENHHDINTD